MVHDEIPVTIVPPDATFGVAVAVAVAATGAVSVAPGVVVFVSLAEGTGAEFALAPTVADVLELPAEAVAELAPEVGPAAVPDWLLVPTFAVAFPDSAVVLTLISSLGPPALSAFFLVTAPPGATVKSIDLPQLETQIAPTTTGTREVKRIQPPRNGERCSTMSTSPVFPVGGGSDFLD